MAAIFVKLVLLGLAVGALWQALDALRSGEVTMYVRANRDRHFSRAANPAAFWTVVFVYALFATVTLAGMLLSLLLP